jgi:hypothetical protein
MTMMALRTPKMGNIVERKVQDRNQLNSGKKINWLLVPGYPAKHKIHLAIFFVFQSL